MFCIAVSNRLASHIAGQKSRHCNGHEPVVQTRPLNLSACPLVTERWLLLATVQTLPRDCYAPTRRLTFTSSHTDRHTQTRAIKLYQGQLRSLQGPVLTHIIDDCRKTGKKHKED
ncbi:hypothetical protein PoB_006835400 [Plakobranchus ocellatus]|uniref:Uncharacterized protein n=1 Tax=Plakobranchus ocellatus TaxID=259542 RepID=A0AAV4DCF8_9GAST|nr:hypothetical protein PoB_006835400 [Plakobranchus ocellatus]